MTGYTVTLLTDKNTYVVKTYDEVFDRIRNSGILILARVKYLRYSKR